MNVTLRLAIMLDGVPAAWTDIPASALEGKSDVQKMAMLGDAMTEVALKLEASAKPELVAPPSEIIVP